MKLTVDDGLILLSVVVTIRLVLTGVIVVVITVVEIDVVAMPVMILVEVDVVVMILEDAVVEMAGVLVFDITIQVETITVIGPTSGLGRCSDRATMEI